MQPAQSQRLFTQHAVCVGEGGGKTTGKRGTGAAGSRPRQARQEQDREGAGSRGRGTRAAIARGPHRAPPAPSSSSCRYQPPLSGLRAQTDARQVQAPEVLEPASGPNIPNAPPPRWAPAGSARPEAVPALQGPASPTTSRQAQKATKTPE